MQQPLALTQAKIVEIETNVPQTAEAAKTVEIERTAFPAVETELPASSGLQPMTAPEPWLRMFDHKNIPSFPQISALKTPGLPEAPPAPSQAPGFHSSGYQPFAIPSPPHLETPSVETQSPEAHPPEAPPPAVLETLTLVDFKPGSSAGEAVPAANINARLEAASEPEKEAVRPSLPRRKTRMTLVQEFDITKLVAETETQSQKVIPIETVDDFNAAMHYFTGQAEGRTYTAELRFRASFTPIQDMKVTSEPEAATVTDDNDWIVAENVFSPEVSEAARVAPPVNSAFNMLDLIDESYRTIQANPTFSQSRQGQAGLSVDWSQPIAKLPDVQQGLMGGITGNTRGNRAQYRNHWSKR
jgi:hypothetical protein